MKNYIDISFSRGKHWLIYNIWNFPKMRALPYNIPPKISLSTKLGYGMECVISPLVLQRVIVSISTLLLNKDRKSITCGVRHNTLFSLAQRWFWFGVRGRYTNDQKSPVNISQRPKQHLIQLRVKAVLVWVRVRSDIPQGCSVVRVPASKPTIRGGRGLRLSCNF